MRSTPAIYAFNRGKISRLGLARTDVERLRLSAEEQTNWMPRTLGSMTLRPGFRHLGSTKLDRPAVMIPFVFETDDLARIELTTNAMRVWDGDAPMTRPLVRSRIYNGDFAANLDLWRDDDELGAVSKWAGGGMSLNGSGSNAAARWQPVRVLTTGRPTEHAVRVSVAQGPVTLKIGYTAGADSVLGETELGTGEHSLAFLPQRSVFYVHLSHRGDHTALVSSIEIERPGPIELRSPFGFRNLQNVRYAQSRDVVFLACNEQEPYRIERRGPRSWSIVKYEALDGPFKPENLSRVTIEPSGLEGDIELTASASLFKPGHVGALFRLSSSGQRAAEPIVAENVFTEAIRVTGVGNDRAFRAAASGAGVAVVTLQRSVGAPGEWEDVQTITEGTTINDDLDNQVVFYRIGVKTGDYTSGVTNVSLTFARGSVDGICRIVRTIAPRRAKAIVLRAFGSTDPTSIWAEGAWSDAEGWPTAVGLFEGRLWWGGRGRLWGSVSDAFDRFDDRLEGDSAAISKAISDGPSDIVSWLGVGQRLVVGTTGGVFEARASVQDEPLTPTSCELRRFSTMGAANVAAVQVEDRLNFVQRAGRELLEAAVRPGGLRPEAARLTAHVPEIGESEFVRVAVQTQPDVRIHCVRADGSVAILVSDPSEDVRCWIEIETDGRVEDVCVLPGGAEDAVYYLVRRAIDGKVRRYHERWAEEKACRGGVLNCQVDAFKLYQNVQASVLAGLAHLEGREVDIWADGTARDRAVVTDGAVDVSGPQCRDAVVGLPYEARFRSVKLAYGARGGTALTQPKRVNRLGFVLADVHADGLRFGPDYERLDSLPRRSDYDIHNPDAVYAEYDVDGAPFPGSWSSDARVCLKAESPKPCTVLGLAIDMETVER